MGSMKYLVSDINILKRESNEFQIEQWFIPEELKAFKSKFESLLPTIDLYNNYNYLHGLIKTILHGIAPKDYYYLFSGLLIRYLDGYKKLEIDNELYIEFNDLFIKIIGNSHSDYLSILNSIKTYTLGNFYTITSLEKEDLSIIERFFMKVYLREIQDSLK